MTRPRVIFVTGATATGKSDFALSVAAEVGAVIVNCDSVQVYQGPVIGSNGPSQAELQKAPHFLYSYVAAPREMSAGIFREDFMALLKTSPAERIFVVGGTGFYFQALEKGMFETPPVPDEISEEVREISVTRGLDVLWQELHLHDPETAAQIKPTDSYRLCRAVELVRSGVKPSEIRKQFQPEAFPGPLLKTQIVVDRPRLRLRIRERTVKMLERGLLEETRGLLAAGPEDWAPLRAVGYKQAVAALKEGRDQQWLVDEITLRTGQLAKRQERWFQRDPENVAFSGLTGFAAFRETCLRFFEGTDTLSSS